MWILIVSQSKFQQTLGGRNNKMIPKFICKCKEPTAQTILKKMNKADVPLTVLKTYYSCSTAIKTMLLPSRQTNRSNEQNRVQKQTYYIKPVDFLTRVLRQFSEEIIISLPKLPEQWDIHICRRKKRRTRKRGGGERNKLDSLKN